MPPLISIENLSFTYPDLAANARKTLHDINLTIEQGEYIAILGANGSGKSTLARMINALLLPDSGTVRIDGRDTSKLANLPEIRKTIGMVFQFPEEQIFSSTIEEDVAFGLENFAIPYKEMHDIVREELEQFDLWDIRERPSYLLSGGQTQRLALAGVLAMFVSNFFGFSTVVTNLLLFGFFAIIILEEENKTNNKNLPFFFIRTSQFIDLLKTIQNYRIITFFCNDNL